MGLRDKKITIRLKEDTIALSSTNVLAIQAGTKATDAPT